MQHCMLFLWKVNKDSTWRDDIDWWKLWTLFRFRLLVDNLRSLSWVKLNFRTGDAVVDSKKIFKWWIASSFRWHIHSINVRIGWNSWCRWSNSCKTFTKYRQDAENKQMRNYQKEALDSHFISCQTGKNNVAGDFHRRWKLVSPWLIWSVNNAETNKRICNIGLHCKVVIFCDLFSSIALNQNIYFKHWDLQSDG